MNDCEKFECLLTLLALSDLKEFYPFEVSTFYSDFSDVKKELTLFISDYSYDQLSDEYLVETFKKGGMRSYFGEETYYEHLLSLRFKNHPNRLNALNVIVAECKRDVFYVFNLEKISALEVWFVNALIEKVASKFLGALLDNEEDEFSKRFEEKVLKPTQMLQKSLEKIYFELNIVLPDFDSILSVFIDTEKKESEKLLKYINL